MQSISFQIPAVNREEEVQKIVSVLQALAGVQSVAGHRQTKIFTMTWTGGLHQRDIINALSAIGYTPDMP